MITFTNYGERRLVSLHQEIIEINRKIAKHNKKIRKLLRKQHMLSVDMWQLIKEGKRTSLNSVPQSLANLSHQTNDDFGVTEDEIDDDLIIIDDIDGMFDKCPLYGRSDIFAINKKLLPIIENFGCEACDFEPDCTVHTAVSIFRMNNPQEEE